LYNVQAYSFLFFTFLFFFFFFFFRFGIVSYISFAQWLNNMDKHPVKGGQKGKEKTDI